MAAVIIPGTATGATTESMHRTSPHPSRRAASTSSPGTDSRNARSNSTIRGTAYVESARMRPT